MAPKVVQLFVRPATADILESGRGGSSLVYKRESSELARRLGVAIAPSERKTTLFRPLKLWALSVLDPAVIEVAFRQGF